MSKGFIILAQNTNEIDYLSCAEALAKSLKKTMPQTDVSILTDNPIKSKYFDRVIKLPYGDLAPDSWWKLINDWQVYEASPYDYTIKLEADLFIPRSINHWWQPLMQRDLVVTTTIRNFKQEISKSRVYRRFIDDNNLPDVYNAITYFNKSEISKTFYEIVRNVFENWNEYKTFLKCNPDEIVTTDWAYAIASHILGTEKTTMPEFTEMSMVHMKQFINDLPTENWTDTLVYEIHPDVLRINTYPQTYPFHYNIKSFGTKLLKII